MRLALGLTAALTLAACDMETAPVLPDPAPENACGAAALQTLVGQPASVLDSMRFDTPTRIIRPDMAVTMDYSPARLNIEIDRAERISRVACG